MSTPETRLRAGLDRLVGDGVLSRDQADAVLREARLDAEPEPEQRHGWTTVLAEVGGYVGAAFVVAAVAVFTGPHWDQLSTGMRLAILASPAAALLMAAVVIARSTPGGWPVHDRPGIGARRRLIAALWLSAGGLLAGVTGVLTSDPQGASGSRQGALVTVTAMGVWIVGYLAGRTPLLHIAVAAATAFVPYLLWDWLAQNSDVALAGYTLLVVAVVWAVLSLRRVLDEQLLGLAVAGTLGFIGAETLTQTDEGGGPAVGYLALAAIALAGLLGYAATRLTVVLVVGVVALATVVPQAVIDYTDGALGAAGALLVSGLSIVGASVLGLRLHRDAADSPPTALP
jgi:hypothetical protein